MKIIRAGNKELYYKQTHKIVQFVCDKCACIWEADNTEYAIFTTAYQEEYAVCNCPNCNHKEYMRL